MMCKQVNKTPQNLSDSQGVNDRGAEEKDFKQIQSPCDSFVAMQLLNHLFDVFFALIVL